MDGDTWRTFMAFAAKWDEAYYRTGKLEEHLPKIWEAGEEDDDIVQSKETADDDETEFTNNDENMNHMTDK
ncbi:MAG TPA: hypothetical protein QGF63_01330, partial [Alphaproteobacteria bacterium]|nr:hypothetical protein [Alphaproteobacteria bacterium]